MHHIELTKRGEAYALRSTANGRPAGVNPETWREAIEARIECHLGLVTALLATLDDLDGDTDLEPSIGSPSVIIAGALVDDCEFDISDCEPSIGTFMGIADLELDEGRL